MILQRFLEIQKDFVKAILCLATESRSESIKGKMGKDELKFNVLKASLKEEEISF